MKQLPLLVLTSVLVAIAALGALWPSRLDAAAQPSATAEVDGRVTVTTTLSRGRLRVGQPMAFAIRVEPAGAEAARPMAIRARLGMPDHGHWITEETRKELDGGAASFDGEFPMSGKYRLRLWIELQGGEQVTTAVDFWAPAEQLEPVVFETKPDPPPPPAPKHADVGELGPRFDLARLDGSGSVSLEGLRGRPVWLAFWASWCGPCRAELPELAEFAQRWSHDATVLGISLDRDREMAAAFLARLGVEVPSVLDSEGVTVEPYGAARIPLNVLLDGEGRIVRRVTGFRPDLYEDGDGWLRDLLANP